MIYQAQVELLSPLVLTVRRATGNDMETLTHVPGTAVRGALAAAYLQGGSAEEDGFRDLFLSDKVRYGNLRVDGADPWPLSARTCREAGLKHPILDLLLTRAAGRQTSAECQQYVDRQAEPCGAKVEQPRGFMKWEKGGAKSRYVEKNPDLRRTAHSAIDSFLLRTKTAQLFSVAGLEPLQNFKGRITAEGSAIQALEQLAKANPELRLGRARTRGRGLVRLRLIRVGEGPSASDRARATQRIGEMQRKAEELGGSLARSHVVTVTLQSPALFWDEYLMARAWLDAASAGLHPDWQLAGWYSQMTTIAGWHAAARVPRTVTPMVAAGSCFAYKTTRPVDLHALAEWAVKLELEGVGERRDEGFGEVAVCHELHVRHAEAK